ncbi:rhodanese-like domain-containing protein [Fusobacterium russii]|uniref:rhodanese-like domain-containing protein n=1 Tax=Fusobacterium russii TaxID=854 RepID=UPI0003A16AD8|nr:rhodanese-like domain-containing protein [Fusobacterium russii]
MKKLFMFAIIVFLTGTFFIKKGFSLIAMNENSYRQISQEEAMQIMKEKTGYIIIDVRTKAEYDDGHIKGAISLPNENITKADINELPDKEQLILVYCRSGNRSRQAAKKLVNKGYTNVHEFGGIGTWKGEIVK